MFIAMGAVLWSVACDKGLEGMVGGIDQDIIGGFPANDPVLDAIGSLVVHFDGGPVGPPGAPVAGAVRRHPDSSETVLTAKHCALIVPFIISLGGRLTFAVGPDSAKPKREVNVVATELAPGDEGGFVRVGHDVAVMHLETPITDLVPVDLAVLADEQIGQPFAAIGYGVQDNRGAHRHPAAWEADTAQPPGSGVRDDVRQLRQLPRMVQERYRSRRLRPGRGWWRAGRRRGTTDQGRVSTAGRRSRRLRLPSRRSPASSMIASFSTRVTRS